ncbi:hypothetical protein B0A49_04099 [Cryomyces minteri]|uniref:ribonuclease III n=1 Tax=Cryomyces minteri TaxID=331657 RepID=A0A4U0XDQ0_9PEZI|nr:hypothetical protein B0A49_04099 [Cryomyces minteri]
MGEKRRYDHGTLQNHAQKKKKSSSSDSEIARLNEKYPETAPYAKVSSHYDSSKDLNPNEPLPPLPPISDPYYAQAPFNHSSTAHLDRSSAVNDLSYERLEFLGDAYVEIIATRIIFSRYPHLPAGRQAQLRELVVKNVTLAQLAQGYDFGKRVRISNQEIESAGENAWTKILADVFEAYVAALVLSSPADGFETVEAWLTQLWAPLLVAQEKPVVNPDAKGALARKLVSRGVKLEYEQERKMEMDKSTSTQKYFIGVYLTGWGHVKRHLGSGTGQNKVQAGANAAADAMEGNKDLIEACSKIKAEFDLQRKAERLNTVEEPAEQASVKR